MARFKNVFQLITVVLVIAVVNVYVMGAPMKVVTDPKKADTPATADTKADPVVTEISANKTVTPISVAAEKLPLTPGSKINFNRIFSRSEIKSRAAADHSFLNAKATGRDIFKAPPRTGSAPLPDDTTDNNDSKGAWIAVGVIAAVLTVAIIGLRMDRNRD
jgi:hypothetical protein